MKTGARCLFLLLALLGSARLVQGAADAEAQAVRAELLRRLPAEALRIRAVAKTLPEKRQRWVDMTLNWGEEPPHARYTLRDAFGSPRAALRVERGGDEGPVFRYYEGDPLIGAPLPDLDAPVDGMVFSWNDLSLSFLWWPDVRSVGTDEVKGRACWVIDCIAPEGATFPRVRVWIDEKAFILLRAVALDAGGAEQKRLDVKSFKKIDDVWTIKDIDIRLPSGDRYTRLRVFDVLRDDPEAP